jgi:L-lactate dehydrogenase complex protein LldF
VYPGPIGAILTPQLGAGSGDPETEALLASLPFASSLCGACYEVCPVRIDIPEVLVHLRGKAVDAKGPYTPEAVAMAAASWVMSGPGRFRAAQRLVSALRLVARRGRIKRLPWPGSKWTDSRDVPAPPKESFAAWWRRTRG